MNMLSIKELMDRRAAKKADMLAIVEKESDDAPLGDDDVAAFNKLKAEADALEERIARLKEAIEPTADDADEVADDAGEKAWSGETKGHHFNIVTETKAPTVPYTRKGEMTGRWIVGQYFVQKYGMAAARDMIDQKMGGDDFVKKSMLTTSQPIIPQDFNPNWVELLQEKTVVRPICTVYSLPMGNMTIPRQHLGSTGAFFSEGAQITVSQLAFDNIQMTWKKYGAMTYTSRELLDFTPLNAAGIIANDLTSRLGLLEDRTLLFGSSPIVGITGSLASGNTIANSTDSSAVTFQTVSFDLQNLELQLTGNLVQGTFYWIMHPGVVAFLKQLSSTFGVYPFKAELDTGYLNGHRVLTTVQLPTNLGASAANETNILLVCGEQCILGDAYRWAISMTTEGSFVDSSTQVHTFGQDLVAFKATNSIDFSLMHNVSAACLQASNWALSTVGGFDAYTGQAANTAGSSASSASS